MPRTKTTTTETTPKRPRSESRRRGELLGVRLSEEESALLAHARARAEKLGAILPGSDAGLLRWLAMNSASELAGETVVPTRKPRAAVRAPTIDAEALAKVMGEIGRVGNNLNQVARRTNLGDPATLAEVREFRIAFNRIALSIAALAGVRTDRDADDLDEGEIVAGRAGGAGAAKTRAQPAPQPAQRPQPATAKAPGTAWTTNVGAWRKSSNGGAA